MEGEPRPQLSHDDLFSDIGNLTDDTDTSSPAETLLEQGARHLTILRDYVYNQLGGLDACIQANDDEIISKNEVVDSILASNINSALGEATGATTYGKELRETLNAHVQLYAEYIKNVANILLPITDRDLQIEEIQKVFDEVKNFTQLSQLPEEPELVQKLQTLQSRVETIEAIAA